MPIGSHNSRRSLRWSRFYIPEPQAPLSAETIIMYINDIKAFSESFVSYLNAGEVIASYTIEADDGLTITTSANATPLITYTIQADGLTSGGSITLRQVKIVATTSIYTTRAVGTVTVIGNVYRIVAQNTLDFTTIGAADNNAGTTFTADAIDTLGVGDELLEITSRVETRIINFSLLDSEI
jgi:hypothetical protein